MSDQLYLILLVLPCLSKNKALFLGTRGTNPSLVWNTRVFCASCVDVDAPLMKTLEWLVLASSLFPVEQSNGSIPVSIGAKDWGGDAVVYLQH